MDDTKAMSSNCNCTCQQKSIEKSVNETLETYFKQLDGHHSIGLYDMVINRVEKPLFESVLKYCDGNQTKAAMMLGINRGTFRKKMKFHGLLD
ncbi:MAG: DNA-binding transcriptional regulator Fis [Gammaproteobacteria bacterium]|nr:MAG: DNA-binding transcriptional regulator Fis [Gammaproteobacteria bacterium]